MKKPPRKSQDTSRVRVGRSSAGLGLFAATDLKRGDFVIEYVGVPLSTKVADEKNSKYLFELNTRTTIDGSPRWNIARYINHSCRPNCEAIIESGHINIYTKRAIKSGEELSYHYGKEYFEDEIKPFGCRCTKCATTSRKKK